MKILVSILLVLHGLITSLQASGNFSPKTEIRNPDWLGWWPVPLGRSWLLVRLGSDTSAVKIVLGLLWLIAGLMLLAAGSGLLNFIIPSHLWRIFAGIGASLSLILLAIYLHPFFIIGIMANFAILISLLWIGWPSLK